MNYVWYKIYNLTEFQESGLTSRNVQVIFENVGEKNILLTKGDLVSVLFDDVFMTLNLNDENPYAREERAVYLDENNDIWVGVLDEN